MLPFVGIRSEHNAIVPGVFSAPTSPTNGSQPPSAHQLLGDQHLVGQSQQTILRNPLRGSKCNFLSVLNNTKDLVALLVSFYLFIFLSSPL